MSGNLKLEVQIWLLLIIHAEADKCIDCVSHVPLLGGRSKVALQAEDGKKTFLEINVSWLPRLSEDSGEALELCAILDKWASPTEPPSKHIWLEMPAGGSFYYKAISIQ